MPGAPGMASMNYSSTSEDFSVKRTEETSFKWVKKKNFKKEFSNYFEECEIVKAAILNNKLTHKDIESIVRKYNYCK